MQAGVVGLLRALERYDPSLGTPFWAYATWWVRQAMQQLVADLSRPVVLSDRALRHLARLQDARRALMQRIGREPTTAELMLASGLSRAQMESLLAVERRPRPLDEPVHGEESTAASFGESLADPRAEDPFDAVPRRSEAESLPEMLDVLTERERMVVRARYGFDGPDRTLRELAAVLGVSAERVRQIQEGALEKLRAATGEPA
jgi:RNA polymerase primary sigma factor